MHVKCKYIFSDLLTTNINVERVDILLTFTGYYFIQRQTYLSTSVR